MASGRRLERFHLSYAKHREDACTWKIFGSSQKSLVSGGSNTTGLLVENVGWEGCQEPGGEGRTLPMPGHGRGKPLPANRSGRRILRAGGSRPVKKAEAAFGRFAADS